MKKSLSLFLALSLASVPLPAEEVSEEKLDQMISALMEERDPAAFEKLIAEAREAGLAEQTLIETRFLYLIDQGDQKKLAAFAPKMETGLEKFSTDASAVFAAKEDYQSAVAYLYALEALQKGDEAGFKKQITEAFWLSPAQAGIYGPVVGQYRIEKHLDQLRIDLDRQFEMQLEEGKSQSLRKMLGMAPALAIYVWSPWIQQTVEFLPTYNANARVLQEGGVAVSAAMIRGTAESRRDGDEALKKLEVERVGHWFLDQRQNSLTAQLRVESFPMVVLLGRDGKVLYHGNPENPAFWSELARLKPEVKSFQKELVLPGKEAQMTEEKEGE